MDVQLVADLHNLCGEAPLWDFRCQRLVWNDLSSNLVFEHDPATGQTHTISNDLMVACIALNGESRFVFGGSSGLGIWQRGGTYRTLVLEEKGSALNFNEILAAPDGSVYANTAYWEGSSMQVPGKLYHMPPGGSMQMIDEGFELANGMGFSPDNKKLYLADSAARIIYQYDVLPGSGQLANRRVFVKVPADEGLPDGLTVDAEGFIWSAQWYGSQIVRYAPDGKIERRISMPAKQVSSLNFGGVDLTELYITTAAESWPSHLAPPGYDWNSGKCGGGLYRVKTDIPGKPEHIARLV